MYLILDKSRLSFVAEGTCVKKVQKIARYVVIPMCVVGLLSNLIIVFVLSRDKTMNVTTKFLMQQLALADCVFYITCPFREIPFAKILGPQIRWQELQVFPHLVSHIVESPVVWMAVVATHQRYMAISRPLSALTYNKMSRARVKIVVVWIGSIIINIPSFLHFWFQYQRNENLVYWWNIPDWCALIIITWLPISLVVFFNIRIIDAVRKSNALHKQQQSSNNSKVISNDRRVTVTLIVLLIVFLACQLPSAAYQTFHKARRDQIFYNSSYISENTSDVCPLYAFGKSAASASLVVVNSFADYVTYFLMGKRFRQILIRSLLCCTSKK
jgi:hypothetical protein